MNQTAEPMVLRVRAEAPPARVMQALTTPAEMTLWLAEHAEVSLPDRYCFWGRYTPDGERPSQRLVASAADRIRFAWTVDGVDTDVGISLEPAGDGTLLTLRQSCADPTDAGPLGQLQTFWAATLANLVDHVEDRPVLDQTDLTSPELRAETTICASVDDVFSSLVDPEQVSAWFGFPTDIVPEVGGQYGFGTITELEEGRRLSVDYGPMGVATWELADAGGKTRLVMTQSGFAPDQTPYAAWLGAVSGLAELRRFHEVTPWQPIWIAAQ